MDLFPQIQLSMKPPVGFFLKLDDVTKVVSRLHVVILNCWVKYGSVRGSFYIHQGHVRDSHSHPLFLFVENELYITHNPAFNLIGWLAMFFLFVSLPGGHFLPRSYRKCKVWPPANSTSVWKHRLQQQTLDIYIAKVSEAYLQKCVCRNEKTQWLHILVCVHLVCERSTVPVDCYQAVNIGQMRQPARIAATSIECKLANLWSRYSWQVTW